MNAIETCDLTRAFGERVVVERLALAAPRGAVFGFLGPNGAGKTTTVRMLAALIAPTSGSAVVAGYRLGEDDQMIRRHVGLLTESPGLYDRLSARQNLIFFARLYDLDTPRAGMQTERYLRMLGLWERCDDPVGSFSKGMRQKLAIARALLHEPQIIFLDEPTAGLDPEAARTVREFIKELRAEGRTIFLTTHNLPEADELCDLIAVFRIRLLRIGAPAALRAELFGAGVRIRIAGAAESFMDAVRALPFVHAAAADGDALNVSLDNPDEHNPILVRALIDAGAAIRYVEPREPTLEDVYLQLVREGEPQEQPYA
ncbi:MAG: multidrug ABC transporter ATP-binding protein [Roseiflexus castenholzii]|uniref:ABC transporter ATP-binding protein n=1 Tax=Roseiflexus castenholzii TaxID=120962 RepID=UPI000CC1C49A|nr:MAG: multidrug ABC transporter ATP-binding protein [Roseiflexus castenholzii]